MSQSEFEVRISQELNDPGWDSFLLRVGRGSFTQTSWWGQVKSSSGWKPVRIVVLENGEIVGGVQFLLRKISRRVPGLGSVGYVSRGPVIPRDDWKLKTRILQDMQEIVKTHRIQYLIVQPLESDSEFESSLIENGFSRSLWNFVIQATSMIDLQEDLDDLLRKMKRTTREEVRQSLRRGIEVREGTVKDLTTFHLMMVETCRRQGVTPHPADVKFLIQMWNTLFPIGHCHLLLTEYEGSCVAGIFNILFGDRVIGWKIGWNGEQIHRRPSQRLIWESMKRGKERGFRYYDFAGIDTEVAQKIDQGQVVPREEQPGATRFKLAFGGDVVLLPEVYEWVQNPCVRFAYRKMIRPVLHSPRIKGALLRGWSKLHS